jgi:hypothetical protein
MALIFTGCAGLTPQEATNMMTYDLCRKAITGRRADKEVAKTELDSRAENCREYIPLILEQQRQKAELIMMYNNTLQSGVRDYQNNMNNIYQKRIDQSNDALNRMLYGR